VGDGTDRPEGDRDPAGGGTSTDLDEILGQLDLAVDPVAESAGMSPALGIAVAGGPMVTLPPEDLPHLASRRPESLIDGVRAAGPVAVAGLVVNAASVVVVVVVARMVTARQYGVVAQLLGLFFILSMPGSALQVGVVRRVADWGRSGIPGGVKRWAAHWHRIGLVGLVVLIGVVTALQGRIASALSLPDSSGVVGILSAAGVWILLCIDRGLLQARRTYTALAANLVVEGAVRTVAVVGLVAAGAGVSGYAAGVLLGEVLAWLHARWAVAFRERGGETGPQAAGQADAAPPARPAGRTRPPGPRLWADVSAAFVGLALLALLQNMDVIVLGREAPAASGAYAAVSVASKALVFGALALGSYLLPEATIRWNEGGHAVRQLGVTLVFLAVPTVLLLAVSVVAPRQFLSLFFSAAYVDAAPAFVWLVASMAFLCVTVLVTNYLFGAGRRWIVLPLAAGSLSGVVLVAAAHGDPVATARADLAVQATLAACMVLAFAAVHHREERVPLGRWLHLVRPSAGLAAHGRATRPRPG
jgi:O-antigen/teichoic acid export membrane protein